MLISRISRGSICLMSHTNGSIHGDGVKCICTVQYYSIWGCTSEGSLRVHLPKRHRFVTVSKVFVDLCCHAPEATGGQKLEISTRKLVTSSCKWGVTQGGSVFQHNCQILLFASLQSFESWGLHSNRRNFSPTTQQQQTQSAPAWLATFF